jgi:hypothetical protein
MPRAPRANAPRRPAFAPRRRRPIATARRAAPRVRSSNRGRFVAPGRRAATAPHRSSYTRVGTVPWVPSWQSMVQRRAPGLGAVRALHNGRRRQISTRRAPCSATPPENSETATGSWRFPHAVTGDLSRVLRRVSRVMSRARVPTRKRERPTTAVPRDSHLGSPGRACRPCLQRPRMRDLCCPGLEPGDLRGGRIVDASPATASFERDLRTYLGTRKRTSRAAAPTATSSAVKPWWSTS